ncbi:hypothetical protein P3T36_005747 [Kitasatospora sp. MAP12-15]|uniref:hypothetical protein n=1 Tax=unclassified Kitasatospora TaxID=2633591 RepID=UPI00247547EE|nr:hypothetical protein [Kitasatospora sp. MAP12-44]MDH6110021.1 hypothetical protein [Kitasatospora sp. MAP12-44]
MSIGLLVLYAALAAVALWLIAELLLQNRAPLHWRGVALGGFVLVVAGMAIRSVPLIGAGALAFATGQVFVTLAVKSGKSRAWSLRSADGALPGPLAKVPLLSAATSGEPTVAAVAAAVPVVGEVGPIEDAEHEHEAVPDPLAGDEYGVYEPTAEYQQEQPQQQQPEQHGYQPYGDQQQWQQQPVPGYEQGGYPQQQNYEYYQQQPQQPYQDPYWQQQQQQQQQPYDPAQYQPEYGVPQQPQSYEYYQQPETWHQQQQ